MSVLIARAASAYGLATPAVTLAAVVAVGYVIYRFRGATA